MLYISGLHALNLPCSLDTTGDWHASSMDWENMCVLDSSFSPWKDYGIEKDREIPYASGIWAVANHIRACLDLLLMEDFSNAKGMRNDYIGNDAYNKELFSKVLFLKEDRTLWPGVDSFMEKEYLMPWIRYKEKKL